MFGISRKFAAVLVLLIVCLVAGCSKPAPKPAASGGSVETAGGAESGKSVATTAAEPSSPGDVLNGLMGRSGKVTSYKMTMEEGGKTIEMYMKLGAGKPISMKAGLGQQGKWSIMRMDKKIMYMLDEKTKTAMSMPMNDPKSKGPMPKDVNYKDLLTKKPKISSEKLDGIDCWKIEVTGDAATSSTAWVDKEFGLARQVISGGKTIKMNYELINGVPDSAFELPAGTKVKSMGDMMRGMPNMQNMPKMPDMPKMPGR